jgi:hypothetical protein
MDKILNNKVLFVSGLLLRKIKFCSNTVIKTNLFHYVNNYKRYLSILLFSFVLSQFFVLCLYSSTPNKIKYQGTLKEKGSLVTGKKTMKFRITNSDGSIEYWTSGDVSVDVTQGVINYTLEPTGIDWQTGGYYLEVTIDGTVLLPREEIGSTVYALQAKNIDDGVVVTAKIADGAVTSVKKLLMG